VTATESALPATDTSPHTEYPDAVRMALGAIATVGVSFFLCHLPYGRLATVLLSLLAVGLAGLSLLGLTRRSWLGWLGVGVNGLFAVLLVGFPDVFGLTGWWPVPPTAPAQPAGISSDGWVDAGEAAWEENGVRVALTFATVAPPPAGPGRASAEPNLWIGVRVTNVGTNPVEFTGWDTLAQGGPVLTTREGACVSGRRSDAPKAKTLVRGQSAESVLAFNCPPPGQALRLALPASAYGGTTPAQFQIAPELILRK
jgi:hypothetical protein